MTNKITITLHADEITPKGIQNAVRRATSQLTEIPVGGKIQVKGLTIKTREVKTVKAESKADVRDWLAANGHPEVVGRRGRIARDLLAKFEAAHK